MTTEFPTSSDIPRSDEPRVSPRLVRRLVIAVFVAGIIGMIVSSILASNGAATTFGLITAVAAMGLVLVTSVTPPSALGSSRDVTAPTIDPAIAADVETRVAALVDAGADESEVRRLVGRAVELGRGH